MDIINQILYFIIIIGVLVLVHELGHFLSAKLFKMRVDRFSIGFPPRAFGKKIGETDYCVSWLPIGGYVKIAGMIDESLDTEHLNRPAEPWEFRAKPIWQRVIVISAGVIMNIILAVFIFWGLSFFKGKTQYAVTSVGYVEVGSPAEKAGFYSEDKITSVNNNEVKTWEDVIRSIYFESLTNDVHVRIERNGQSQMITLPRGVLGSGGEPNLGLVPSGIATKVQTVESGKPAQKIGLKPGDEFVKINDKYVFFTSDVLKQISANPNKTITLEWKRNGQLMSSYITPNESGRIGIAMTGTFQGPIITESYGIFESFAIGVTDLTNYTAAYVVGLGQIITGKLKFAESVGGPIKIAELASQSAKEGADRFFALMAMLSIGLAIINIFPFPALDGGHILFLIYEAIFRKEVPNKIRIVLQQAGMVILLGLMVFIIYNDIFH